MVHGAHASALKVPTGIPGFDEICDGGLPRGGITVVFGGAGSGKTTLGLQLLATGASDYDSPGILVAFEESPIRLVANSDGFSWGGGALKGRAVHFLDAQLPASVESAGEFDLLGLLSILSAKIEEVGAERVVFDGIDVLLGYLQDHAHIRREMFRLREWVYRTGLTTVVTAKADDEEGRPSAEYGFLQFMADCVVSLHHRVVYSTALRSLRISKYRGAKHSSSHFPVTITANGLEVISPAGVARSHPVSDERVPTGIERLDTMLCGGYHRGSSVLVTGAPGTAKTTLGAAFAEAAARRGERTLFVSFDEAPLQIARNVASAGVDLAPHIASGVLTVRGLRTRRDGPDDQVAQIQQMMRELSPSNVVIDPLSAIGHLGFEVEAEAAAQHIIDLAKSNGVTIFSTSLLGGPTPLSEATPLNISTIADTWMHLSYTSQAGERNRALTIIKSRGTGHSNQVRELVLSATGVTLADVYAVDGEVLMGTLRWEKENEAKRARDEHQRAARLTQRKAELALAETRAQLDALSRELAIREAELEQVKASAAAETDSSDAEADARLQLRRVDGAAGLSTTAKER